MRTTVVPAQITTVEDKIAGNLGMSQIMLLTAPIFIGSAIFVILPPFFNYATYKVVLIALMALLCGVLAVRIKGKVLLFWAIAILRYNLRPMYYVFDKNSMYMREVTKAVPAEESIVEAELLPAKRSVRPKLSPADLLKVQEIIANPAANLHITTTKKGALRVHLTEVTSESLSTGTN